MESVKSAIDDILVNFGTLFFLNEMKHGPGEDCDLEPLRMCFAKLPFVVNFFWSAACC